MSRRGASSKGVSVRNLPKRSSYANLNPLPFKSQFFGYIGANEIEKEEAVITRKLEKLKMQMRDLENAKRKLAGDDFEMESDEECDDDMDPLAMSDLEFESRFDPNEMRCLGLVAHNHMKPAMKQFVLDNMQILKKFRLTGTNTTMTMLKEVFGDDPSVMFGPTCQSGPLGGDAELCALMCMEDLGGMIFMQDPMDAHPHQSDIACLNRLANVYDVLVATNPMSAYALTAVLRLALQKGKKGMIASFFRTEYSPSVDEFKRREEEIQDKTIKEGNAKKPTGNVQEYDDNGGSKIKNDLEIKGIEKSLGYVQTRDSYIKAPEVERMEGISESVHHKSFRNATMTKQLSVNTATLRIATMKKKFSQAILDLNVETTSTSIYEDEADCEEEKQEKIWTEVKDYEFYSEFLAEDMRCLALLAQNHMKPAMQEFVINNKNILRKFRLTGTDSTMKMLKEVFQDDPTIRYGPACQSEPLGGDAQLCALMCMEELGGMIFLQDPMCAHAHQVDIDCLNRQCNVHDIYLANNSHSANAMMTVLKQSLKKGNKARISSFFETKVSPAVHEYKRRQKAVLDSNMEKAKSLPEEPKNTPLEPIAIGTHIMSLPCAVDSPVPVQVHTVNGTHEKKTKKKKKLFQIVKKHIVRKKVIDKLQQ